MNMIFIAGKKKINPNPNDKVFSHMSIHSSVSPNVSNITMTHDNVAKEVKLE